MARPKDPDLECGWRLRLQRQASSGLSIAAFCASEGLSSASFHSWKRRLAARSLPARLEPPLFVPLHLKSENQPTQAGPAPSRGVELELPHQVRLRFDSPPEPEWLGRVVAALACLPRREATP
jgi:hypothetical protein